MGITLLPFELSKYFTNSETENEKENDIILLIQKGLYYFTFALSYLIIPVFMEYKKLKEQESDQIERNLTTEDSEFSLEREVENSTCGSLFLKALKNQVAYYVTLVAVILVIVIVSLSLIYHFNIKIDVPSYLRIFPSISNFYNLIWYGFTIGFGIIKIPISIFRKSNFLYQIREISAQLADEDGISLECKNYLMDQAERERNKVIVFLNLYEYRLSLYTINSFFSRKIHCSFKLQTCSEWNRIKHIWNLVFLFPITCSYDSLSLSNIERIFRKFIGSNFGKIQ